MMKELELPAAPERSEGGTARRRKRAFPPIYTFDLEQNKIHLVVIGHRREILSR